MSALPGMPLNRSSLLFARRQTLLDYLQAYTRHFRLPVETRCAGTDVQRQENGWRISMAMGELRARHLIVATGIMSDLRLPRFEGQEEYPGRVIHSGEYRRPDPYIGKQVLVVGAGNSGAEIAKELSRAEARVAISIRKGANFVPLTLLGIPI